MEYLAYATSDATFSDCVKLIMETLPGEMPSFGAREYFSRKPETLTECDYLATAVDPRTGNAVGVISVRYLEDLPKVLFVETILIGERHHGSAVFGGIVTKVVEALFRDGRGLGECVAFKTCNPRSYCALRSFGKRFGGLLLPTLDGEAAVPPERARRLGALRDDVARVVAPAHRFDAQLGIVLDGSGPIADSFYRELPRSGDELVDGFFEKHVGLHHRLLATLHLGS